MFKSHQSKLYIHLKLYEGLSKTLKYILLKMKLTF